MTDNNQTTAQQTAGSANPARITRPFTEPGTAGSMLLPQVVENITAGIVITNAEDVVQYANRYFCEQSGYDLEEILGNNASLFLSEKTPQKVYQNLWATIKAGKEWQGELLVRRKNGKLYREFNCIFPVLDDQGLLLGYFALKKEMVRRQIGGNGVGGISRTTDPLTGFLNRSTFYTRLDQAIKRKLEGGDIADTLIVAYLDIDRFHIFNEVIGHTLADGLIAEIANRIGQVVRQGDILARIGGDEFAILFEHASDEANCTTLINRVLQQIRQPIITPQRELVATVSIGLANYPRDGEDPASLLNNARVAMRIAKQKGGDNFCFSQPLRKPITIDQLNLASQLRFAVERNELVLHYQPQISLVSGEIIGVEALVRWNRPGFGMVPPGVFIPIAEETGLIVSIGEWVLQETIIQAIAWQREGLPPMKVAVNLAANHFYNSELPSLIDRLLDENDIEPHLIELELTESTMMRNISQGTRIVNQLKAKGVCLSLDDFGTGHASLACLSQFPIDLLKIDWSFVTDVTSNPTNALIVAATVAMAHKLGKNVIAEGVETEAQMAFLRRLNCDQMQGFLFSKPRPSEEIGVMLKEGQCWQFKEEEKGKKHLLLVDDDRLVVRGLRRAFYRSDYQVHTATSGEEALAIMATTSVQVIISDQLMPGMTGIELLSRVKKIYPDAVRIILSGYAELATVTEAINHGEVWKYLMKPWSDDLLRQVVQEAFRHREKAD
ncbi:MAG: EAL domain-containing protein [Desulfobulbus sp.]|nr:EAL domain-containing protein [Desulfobulbus sp.]